MIDTVATTTAESLLRQPGTAAVAAGMLYLACLLLAIRLFRRCMPESQQRSYWLIVIIALMSAGIGEALGLPAQVTQMMRAGTVAQGLYYDRWGMQIEGIIAFFAIYITVAIILKPLIPPDRGSATVFHSLGMLLTFIAIRAVSVHEVDRLLRMPVAGQITLNNLIEGSLLFLVFWRLRAACRIGENEVKFLS